MCLRPLLFIGSPALCLDIEMSRPTRPPKPSLLRHCPANCPFYDIASGHKPASHWPRPARLGGGGRLFCHHLSHIFAPDQSPLEQHTLRAPWIIRDNAIHARIDHAVHLIHFVHGPSRHQ